MPFMIPSELALRVKLESGRLGLSPNEYAAQLIENHLFKAERERREKAIALLQLWIDEGNEEQKEVGEYLTRVLAALSITPSQTLSVPPQSCGQ